MKPFYTKVTTEFDSSVTIRYEEREQLYPHWHYHDEYELVFMHTSSGERYVGDSINPYSEEDLVLLGSRLPHIWINKKEEGVPNRAAFTVLHFKPQFVKNGFFDLPLMENARKLFEQSSRGIRFVNFPSVEKLLYKIHVTQSLERVIAVMELLSQLVAHEQVEFLSSTDYHRISSGQQNDRLTKIHDYLAIHFKEKISLDTLAELANMTPQAFCAYFKSKTRKTVFTYINDLKIGFSCKLLIETDLNIDQVAQQSGYNTTTFFNRKFKEKIKLTPKEYRKKFMNTQS